MRCPECSSTEDKVLETRISKDKDLIRRRRECLKCSARFSTQEEIIRTELYVIKSDGRREEFSSQKIAHGLKLACLKRPVSMESIDAIIHNTRQKLEKNFGREIPAKEIGKYLVLQLKKIDEVAYVRFASVYRKFKDADEFISEIHKLKNAKN